MAAHDLKFAFLPFYIADISTADQIYVPVPSNCEGEVVEIRSAIDGAITVADATLTPKIGGTAMTNGAITVAYSGSAAGDTDASYPTANNVVVAGNAIEIETDGGSTTAAQCFGIIVIRR